VPGHEPAEAGNWEAGELLDELGLLEDEEEVDELELDEEAEDDEGDDELGDGDDCWVVVLVTVWVGVKAPWAILPVELFRMSAMTIATIARDATITATGAHIAPRRCGGSSR